MPTLITATFNRNIVTQYDSWTCACLRRKLDQTKLTHLANSVLRLLVARVRASDNGKQANSGMVVVLQVKTNVFLARSLIPT